MAQLGSGAGSTYPDQKDTAQTFIDDTNPLPDSSSRWDAAAANDILTTLTRLEAFAGVASVGNAALAYVDAATVKLVHAQTGADPSNANPIVLRVDREVRLVFAPLSVGFPAGLDAGAEAAGTDYYVWATRDGSTDGIGLKISASKTAPAGLTTKQIIGGFHNDPVLNILSESLWSYGRGERDKEGMTRVGGLWVDIYLASVWTSLIGGIQKGSVADDYGCADHGGDCAGLYARSVYNVTPSRYVSWFQAQRLCMNHNKRLLTNAEWQGGALGTPDPGATPGALDCNTSSGGPSATGTRTNCRSWAGLYDMVGNLWEWAADWFVGTQKTTESPGAAVAWGPGLLDFVWNARGAAYGDGNAGGWTDGIPAAALRGGRWDDGAGAGVFSLNLNYAPWNVSLSMGFRCTGQ